MIVYSSLTGKCPTASQQQILLESRINLLERRSVMLSLSQNDRYEVQHWGVCDTYYIRNDLWYVETVPSELQVKKDSVTGKGQCYAHFFRR